MWTLYSPSPPPPFSAGGLSIRQSWLQLEGVTVDSPGFFSLKQEPQVRAMGLEGYWSVALACRLALSGRAYAVLAADIIDIVCGWRKCGYAPTVPWLSTIPDPSRGPTPVGRIGPPLPSARGSVQSAREGAAHDKRGLWANGVRHCVRSAPPPPIPTPPTHPLTYSPTHPTPPRPPHPPTRPPAHLPTYPPTQPPTHPHPPTHRTCQNEDMALSPSRSTSGTEHSVPRSSTSAVVAVEVAVAVAIAIAAAVAVAVVVAAEA